MAAAAHSEAGTNVSLVTQAPSLAIFAQCCIEVADNNTAVLSNLWCIVVEFTLKTTLTFFPFFEHILNYKFKGI